MPALAAQPAAAAGPPALAELAEPSPPAAPRGFSVVRDPAAPLDLLLTWRPPADSSEVARYVVSIVSGGKAQMIVLPADQGSYRVTGGAGSQTATWRVRVGSRSADGVGGDAGWVIVWPAVPSAPSAIAGGRGQGDRTRIEVGWAPPLRAGWAPVDAYRVELVRLKDRSSQILETTATSAVFDGAAVADTHVVRVTALTELGGGAEARLMIGNQQPGSPRSFAASRSADDVKTVAFSWDPPTYAGIGPVTGYRLGWRRPGGRFHWDLELPADARSTSVAQHPADRRFWSLRAVNDRAASFRVRDVMVGKASDAPVEIAASATPPVAVSAYDRTVRVELAGAVPLSASRVSMSLEPQQGSRFRDAVDFPRDSRVAEIGDVPVGIYRVTVTAHLAAGPRILHAGDVTVGAGASS